MKKSLVAVGVVGLFGLTSVAMAAEFDWYGSIRAGVTSADDGKGGGAKLDLGKNTSSRIGINASTDLGNGQLVGAQIEFGIAEPGEKSLNTRRRNVWIQGGWGKLTLGKQGGIYRSAANWDQANYLGGNVRYGGDVDGAEGITYASNLSGPFRFDFEVVGEDGIEQWATTAHYNFGLATINIGLHKNKAYTVGEIDAVTGVGAYTTDAGVTQQTRTITITKKVDGKPSFNNTAISVNGSSAGFDWYLAYENSRLNAGNPGSGIPTEKYATIGAFASYNIDGSGKIYTEYESGKTKASTDKKTAVLVGYSQSLGEGVSLAGEYVTVSDNDKGATTKSKTLTVVLKYSF